MTYQLEHISDEQKLRIESFIMLSVRSFLSCASLENFGIVYGWYSLVTTVVVGVLTCSATVFLLLNDGKYFEFTASETFMKRFHAIISVRFGLVVLVELSYLGFFVYFTLDFIKGIKQVGGIEYNLIFETEK